MLAEPSQGVRDAHTVVDEGRSDVVKGRRTEVEQRAYRFLSTRWKARTELIMAYNILPETLDSLVRKGWAVVSTGVCLTHYKKARR